MSRKGPLYIIKAYCRRCCRPRERVYCKILQRLNAEFKAFGVFYTFSAGVGLSSCKNIKKVLSALRVGRQMALAIYSVQCGLSRTEQPKNLQTVLSSKYILITYKNIYIYLCNLRPKYIHITSKSISVMCDIDISSCWWIRL